MLWTARGETTEIRTARSRDGGRTFEPPVTLQAAGAAGDRGWPALALDARGTAHAIWLDHRGLAAGRPPERIMPRIKGHRARRRRDGAEVGPVLRRRDRLAVHRARARDRRVLLLQDRVDRRPRGALFAAWRHVYPGNIRDIAFTVSPGWRPNVRAPVRVSEDGWAIAGCPDDGPAMAVDARGTVHLVWPTVIGGPNPRARSSTRPRGTAAPSRRAPASRRSAARSRRIRRSPSIAPAASWSRGTSS